METKVIYSSWMNKYFEFVDKIPDNFMKKLNISEEILFSFIKISQKIFYSILMLFYKVVLEFIKNTIINAVEIYNDFVIQFYNLARWTTIPLNKLWILGWLELILSGDGKEPLDEEGLHYITGLQGSGKSSLMFAKMKDYAHKTGRASYVNTKMEKPKLSVNGYYVYHRLFSADEFYKDKVAIKQFNTEMFCSIVYDELHFFNNNRMNRSNDYNSTFIPMINDNVLMRHKNIKWVLYSSQFPRNDIQIMTLLKGYHRVKVKKGIDYRKWLETGKFEISLLGWRIKSYELEISENNYKLKLVKRWFKRNNNYLGDYDTLAMRDVNKDVPIDRPRKAKG